MFTKLVRRICVIGLSFGVCGAANATFHLNQITQLYSNTDGTVQFIELKAYAGGQQFLAGHTITSSQGATSHSFAFPSDLPGDTGDMMSDGYYGMMYTTYKSFLIGTQGFAALGVVRPDYIVPNGFLFSANGRVTFAEGADTLSYTSLPTDGSLALNRNGATSVNSATNFSGATGSVHGAVADYTGAWGNDTESGWGLSVVRGGISGLYGIIMYHYNQSSTPSWYFMSGGSFNGNVYSADVLQFSGPFFGGTFNPLLVTHSAAGSASINFTSATTATLSYTINGTTVSNKSLTKTQF